MTIGPFERYYLTTLIRFTEQSRRDDLESLGYVFMYFLRGSLPWQGLKVVKNERRIHKIGEKKATTPIKELCEGYPGKLKQPYGLVWPHLTYLMTHDTEEFGIYLNYVRKLGFDETPDYDFLCELFANVMMKNNYVYDGAYDWNTAPPEEVTLIISTG
jgi:casein kinase 1